MFEAVKEYLEANQGSWVGIPAFGNTYNVFVEKLSQMKTYAYSQAAALIGVRSTKQQKLEETAELAVEVAGAVFAYASSVQNIELKAYMKVSNWKIVHNSKFNSLYFVAQVIEKAAMYQNEIEDFGVDEAKLNRLIVLHDELEAVLKAERQAVVARKLATASIRELVSEIDAVLNHQLDKLALSLRSSEPKFYTGYTDARIVIDRGGRHKKTKEDQSPNQNNEHGASE